MCLLLMLFVDSLKGAAEVIVIEVFLFTVLYPEILHLL